MKIIFFISEFLMYLCTRFEKGISGCSAVRLAHLLWEQGVVGSNPATPTIENQPLTINFVGGFFMLRHTHRHTNSKNIHFQPFFSSNSDNKKPLRNQSKRLTIFSLKKIEIQSFAVINHSSLNQLT